MAPSQCFGFSNLTLHGYTSDRKDSNYKSQAPSLAKVIHSDNTKVVFEMSDPAGKKAAEMSRELEDMKAKLEAALAQAAASAAQATAALAQKEVEKRRRIKALAQKEKEKCRRISAEEKIEPLTLGEYFQWRHNANIVLNLPLELHDGTKGPVADAEGRVYPRSIIPWAGFKTIQDGILKKIPMKTKLSQRNFATRSYLLDKLEHPELISSEQSLTIRQAEAITGPVTFVMKHLERIRNLWPSLGIQGTADFQSHKNTGTTKTKTGTKTKTKTGTKRTRSAAATGKTGPPDLYCKFMRICGTLSEVIMVVEYKPPHKLPLIMLMELLDNIVSIHLDDNFIDKHTENQRLVAAVIIQLFAAMVNNDVQYGYIDTGEALVFLHIKANDPFTVEYYISDPKSDVEKEADADGKLRLSAVSQVLAFTIQAMKAPKATSSWLARLKDLPKWKDARIEANDISSGPDLKDKFSPYKRKNRKREPHPSDPDPAVTRSAFQSANRLAEEPNDEDKADDSQQGKKKSQNLGRRKIQSDVFNRSYCTHECIRGLAFGTPLDKNCPNVKDHGSKHIDRQEFLRLMRDQLDGENAHAHCKPINASGHIGHLFKICLLPHGYTLVTKAVGLCDSAPLIHEEKMYNYLRDLQGRFIPACAGYIELKWIFRGEAYDNTAFRHFLFLSYAGKPVLKALSKVNYSVVREVLDALAQLHQRRVMHRDAAPRNMLYDARTGRYMVIDLELSEPIDGEVPEAVDAHIQKGKRKWEDDRESEPFATESQSLFASLSSSIRAC
ncbi:hypothetical protein E4U52_005895 [Claviceps spartinae]|nr:hypothetical protein E4U52_005895 [Claviceps spartinae]